MSSSLWQQLLSRSVSKKRSNTSRRASGSRLIFESLEARDVPAVLSYTATTVHDLTLLHKGTDIAVVQTSNPLNVLASQPAAVTTSVGVKGADNVTDVLTVNHANGIIGVPVFFSGGSGGTDQIVLKGASFGAVGHTLSAPGAGVINQGGNTVEFTGVEAIADLVGAAKRTVTFPDTDNNIAMSSGAIVNDGLTRITSSSARINIDFVAPAQSLTLNGGARKDTFAVSGVDFGAATPTINLNGNDGDDAFTLTFRTLNTFTVDGGIGNNSATINNSRVVGAAADGLVASRLTNLQIANGSFTNNYGHGISASNVGTVSLDAVQAENNVAGGLIVDIGNTVTINNGSYSTNGGDGVALNNISGAVALDGASANKNSRSAAGVHVRYAGAFSDKDGGYQRNDGGGVFLESVLGDVTLFRTTADNNDANHDGIGDGFRAVVVGNSGAPPGDTRPKVAIGGALTIQGGHFCRGLDGEDHQINGIYVADVTGPATIESSANFDLQVLRNEADGAHIARGATAAFLGGNYSYNNINIDLQNLSVFAHLTTVTANNAKKTGLVVANATAFKDTDGIYSHNADGGIVLTDIAADVTLLRTTANDNDANADHVGDGFAARAANQQNAIGGDLVAQASHFDNNFYGMSVKGIAGKLRLEDFGYLSMHVDGNQSDGVVIETIGATATISGGEYSHNTNGIDIGRINGAVALTNVAACYNGGDGVFIFHAASFSDSQGLYGWNGADKGAGDGLELTDISGDVDLTFTKAFNNTGDGFAAENFAGKDAIDGALFVTGGSFNKNGDNGFYVDGIGVMAWIGVDEAVGNGSSGIDVEDAVDSTANVFVFSGNYSNNGASGLLLSGLGDVVSVKSVIANQNGDDGITVLGGMNAVGIFGVTAQDNDHCGVRFFYSGSMLDLSDYQASIKVNVADSLLSDNSIGICALLTRVAIDNNLIVNNTKDHWTSGVKGQSGIGIAVEEGAQVTATRNTLNGNTVGAQLSDKDGVMELTGNIITNNAVYGVNNTTAHDVVDLSAAEVIAALNYWGSASGPTAATNPSGTGDKASAGVVFTPWATTGACDAAAAPTIIDGNLVIGGTTSNDAISVDINGANFAIAVNGQNYSVSKAAVTGHITIYAFAGNDTVTVSASTAAEIHGGDGADTLTGGAGDDVIWGDTGDDSIWGGDGNDVQIGGEGHDYLHAVGGDDVLIGGALRNGLNHDDVEPYNFATLKAIGQNWANLGVMDADLATLDDDLVDRSADELWGGPDADWGLGNFNVAPPMKDIFYGYDLLKDEMTSF